MPRASHLILVLVFVPMCSVPAGAQPHGTAYESAKQAARDAAASWLADVDDGDFDDSWEAAAPVFQARMSREVWEEQGSRLRDSIQTGAHRTLTMLAYRDSLRGERDGPFVILKYRSTVGDTDIHETVVATRENNTWKVAGYQVAPRSSSPVRTLELDGEN